MGERKVIEATPAELREMADKIDSRSETGLGRYLAGRASFLRGVADALEQDPYLAIVKDIPAQCLVYRLPRGDGS